MAQTFLLPDLGEGLTEAEIVRWLVAEGETVAVDQAVVEVETAKSLVEVPSPYAGTVETLHAAEGQTVDVGRPLITVAVGAGAPGGAAGVGRTLPGRRRADLAGGRGLPRGGEGGLGQRADRLRHQWDRRVRPSSPAAAGRPGAARDRGPVGLDRLHRLPGAAGDLAAGAQAGPRPRRRPARSRGHRARRAGGARRRGVRDPAYDGPRGRSGPGRRAGLPAPTAPLPAAPAGAGEQRIPLNGFRKTVAAALSRSRAEIPEATVWVDVDATALWDLRESARTATDAGPGILAYLARFVVAALKEHPVLNARLDTERDEIVTYDTVNLGLAVQGDRGLVVPAVLGADRMTTAGLDTAIRDLTARARDGRATAEELAAGTFTLNNYGGFNVDGSAAIINHPQVAILGFGRIIDRPWVVDGELCVRKITQMSFVFDHRVCDGGTAAGFMRSVADAVENPASAIARL